MHGNAKPRTLSPLSLTSLAHLPHGRRNASPEWTTAKAASCNTMAPVLDPPAARSKAAQ